MLQVFSKDISTIVLDNIAPQKNIDAINSHINLCNCKNMTVDISKLNISDACMVSTLCSTTHYLKYPEGKIRWITSFKDVEKYTHPVNLGNMEFILK